MLVAAEPDGARTMYMEAVRIAMQALRINRLRSVLTMLGIIIGVAAVILLVSIGNGVQSSVNARVEPLANLITIVPQIGNVPGGSPPKNLIDADVSALQKAPDVATATPATTGPVLVETDGLKFRATVVGSTELWDEVNNRDLQAGSFFDEAQVRSAARVIVVGPTVATTLFGANPASALEQTVRVHGQTFRIIGVMQSYGEDADKSAIMPLNTARRYVVGGGDALNQIIVQAAGVPAVPAAQDEVIRILDDRHRIKDSDQRDFEVQSLGSRLETVNQVLRILTLFTVSVAAISLIVGGIGVLNIMLVSVTERTREIGIRKALGATRRAILHQFLIESTILASLGGLIGSAIGIGLSALTAALAPAFGPTFSEFAPTVSIPSVILSFSVSFAIGLIAGGYPSYRAAGLRPVEALRYE